LAAHVDFAFIAPISKTIEIEGVSYLWLLSDSIASRPRSTKFFVDNTTLLRYIVYVMYRRTGVQPTRSKYACPLEPGAIHSGVVYEELKAARQVGYTTILKFLQIMPEKAWSPEREQRTTLRTHAPRSLPTAVVGDLLDRAFAGSAMQLGCSLVSTATSAEIDQSAVADQFGEAQNESDPCVRLDCFTFSGRRAIAVLPRRLASWSAISRSLCRDCAAMMLMLAGEAGNVLDLRLRHRRIISLLDESGPIDRRA